MFSCKLDDTGTTRDDRSRVLLAGLLAVLVIVTLIATNGSPSPTASDPAQDDSVEPRAEVLGTSEDRPALTRESGLPTNARGPRWWPENLDKPTKYGFIRPVIGKNVGHRVSNLTDISGLRNDGPHGLTIDANFITQNRQKPWITSEGGRTVIKGVSTKGVCLNITTTITLRDSSISCPTRTQSDRWGYVGRDNHAPGINILAPDVTIEYTTVVCTGYDNEICSRTIWGGKNSLIQFNDLSGAAGIVELTSNTRVEYNYMHGLAFGADRRQTNANNNGGITHNNVINSLGYPGGTVVGNYIEATYGRVSANPQWHRTTQYLYIFDDGIIEVGDPLNGFVFAHYPILGSGEGYVARHNYIESAGRAMLCQPSNTATGCASDMSYNAFAKDKFGDFRQQPMFRSTKQHGSFSGECNFKLSGPSDLSPKILGKNIFDNGGTHGTDDCRLPTG